MPSILLSPKARLESLISLVSSAARDAMAEYERSGDLPSMDTVHTQDSNTSSLQLRKAVRVLESACEQLCTTLAPPAHTLVNRSYIHYEPACMRVALESNIAGVIAAHPDGLSLLEISNATGIGAEGLSRILRFLVTRNCFKEVRPGVFANNRLSCKLVANTNLANYLLFMSGNTLKAADNLYLCLKNPDWGKLPAKTPFLYSFKDQGLSDFFDWMKHNPYWARIFRTAMIALTDMLGDDKMLVEAYPFGMLPDEAAFCDLGGGLGQIGLNVARKHPNIRIVLQDLPSVVEESHKFFSTNYPEAVENQRINFVPIDFLRESPVKDQDIYYLRHIIHNWTDDDAILILKNVRSAMKPTSRLLIQEFILLETHEVSPGSSECEESAMAPDPLPPNYGAGNIYPYLQDIHMMCMLNSGERSLAQFKYLGAAAGLEFLKLWDFAYNGMIEFKLPA